MKTIVIGASTTGLFSAYLLARAGVEVEVYERSAVLDFKPRTLIVTGKISEVLGFVPHEIIYNEVKYVEMFSKSRTTTIELSRPDLIIEREKLVFLLARMAEEAGAKIFLGRRFVNFTTLENGTKVAYRDSEDGDEKQTHTDHLIGADGVFSSVARAVSYNGHGQTALLQARVRMPKALNRNTYQVWFDPKRTKYFYWLIPESDDMAAVGLIADNARQASESLKSFLQEQSLEPVEHQASMVPMHKFQLSAKVTEVKPNVYLIGDAAAQVKVTTVGGVVTGLRGARAVSEAILRGTRSVKESSELKRELDLHLLVRRLLDGFTDKDYDTLLDFMDHDLVEILSDQTRDDLSQMYLNLISSQPKLLLLGAKALFRGLGKAGPQIRTENQISESQ